MEQLELEQLKHSVVLFLLFFTFPYKTPESLSDFMGNASGIYVDAESPAHLHRSEVEAVRAVVASCDGDVPTLEHMRIALVGGRAVRNPNEDVVIFPVAAKPSGWSLVDSKKNLLTCRLVDL